MIKIREGVTLRSLEQTSPLNIYVEEADKNFTKLKTDIAVNSVSSFNSLFIPDFNEAFRTSLAAVNPAYILVSLEAVANDQATPTVKLLQSNEISPDRKHDAAVDGTESNE
jgi:preprotein translocase subunit SecA